MALELAPDIAERCRAIELIVLDVDGVLTDGVIALDDNGVELKHFHVRDGAAISFWRRAGKRVAILSGRRAAAVDRRAAELGIDPVVQGAGAKLPHFRDIVAGFGLTPQQAAFMGDDLPDIPPMLEAGLAASPADAAPETRSTAHLITRASGGQGAVRELVEQILGSQGLWQGLVDSYHMEAQAHDQPPLPA